MSEAAPYDIRRLGPDDVGPMRELLAVFAEVFDERATYCDAQPSDAYLRDLLADEHFAAIVALSEGVVVGGLAAYELRKFEQARSELYIYDLGVIEPCRRRGIATALIEEARDIARAMGCWVAFVQAEAGDAPATALYARHGEREDVISFDIPLD